MIRSLLCLAGLAALTAAPATAQRRAAVQPPPNWVSFWVGGYYEVSNIPDPAGEWRFGDGFALGAGFHRLVGGGLALGVEGSAARVPYQSRDVAGTATLLTTLASGRVRYGGSDQLSINLEGGVGAFTYILPELDIADPDFTLLIGGGLDYRLSHRSSIFVQWGRYWAFHPRDAIDTHRANHQHLRVGGRVGW
jgi:hypothetical protein